MDIVLKINSLTKFMGGRKIIDNISFETYAGEVFGFLGPNGAGKTTTIKMALGMLDSDGGEMEICGLNVRKKFEKAMVNVGGIVENPETYGYLTGLQNLRQYKRMRAGVTEERIQEVVRFVGLENRIKDKVKKYSLGMRQRLGVAQAILHKPKLLILDEPTNGLDPAGIRELRDMLKKLAHEDGVAVLVSSHLLSEMELMCDRVGIIANGRILGVKSTKDLMNEAAGNQKIVRFTVGETGKALAVLAEMSLSAANVTSQTFDLPVESDTQASEVNIRLIQAGVPVMGITPLERSLEDIFLEITGEGGNQIA
ncbi:MAG: ABC transporter ATP-binding protein [Oscillospiraceae bacterium]|nr:ABC transporter ATP-binding protein [Oscillospiraceae bacterium]